MSMITTQSPWQSIPWWIVMIIDSAVIALTSCIDQGIGNAEIMTVIINTMMGVQMFLNCNNTGIRGAMALPPGRAIELTDKDQ